MNMTAQEAIAIVQTFYGFRRNPNPPIAMVKAALATALAAISPTPGNDWSQIGGGPQIPSSLKIAQQRAVVGVNRSASTPQCTPTTPISPEQLLHALCYFAHIQMPSPPKTKRRHPLLLAPIVAHPHSHA